MDRAEKPKKIIYAITKSNRGGAQRYVYDLATSLPRSFAPTVLLGGMGPLKKHLEEARIPVVSLPGLDRDVRFLKDISVFFALLREFRRRKPDIVHLNSSKIGGLGALAARLASVPHIIFTAHGWAFNEKRPAIQKAVIKFVYWVTIMLSTKTIAVSEQMRRDVRSFPFVQKKICVVHNGIAPTPLLARADAMSGLQKIAKGMRQTPGESMLAIGVLSELHHVKGLDVLIEAVAALVKEGRRLLVVIMGEGDERPRLERLVEARKLKHVVHLPGYVEDAARYLRAFDIFALPSRSEGFSFAILEAGSAKLPVVASRVGGISEIITDGDDGLLVPPNSPAALAAGLRTLCDDPALRKQLGERLAERVAAYFSKQRMIDATVALYQ